MKKTNIFIFANFHNSDNIAALRFRGLVKYLDKKKFRVYIFACGSDKNQDTKIVVDESTGASTIELKGYTVGTDGKTLTSLLSLASAFFPSIPYLIHGLHGKESWLVNAVVDASKICGERLIAGEKCVAIGTYSPIDALIGAISLAKHFSIPCILDFRDGFVFEALGRKSLFRDFTRLLVERRLIRKSTLVTSVSSTLVEDFEARYPDQTVRMLPNGFDLGDIENITIDDESEAKRIIELHTAKNKKILAHFGRIGASDDSATATLRQFVSLTNIICKENSEFHVLFVGALTASEYEILSKAEFSYSTVKHVKRAVALRMMRDCDALLLLTGNRTSCATGKIFEYLATARPIMCFSLVRNAACDILDYTGAGQSVIFGGPVEYTEIDCMFAMKPINSLNIYAFNKMDQAKTLARWVDELTSDV